MGTAYSVVGIPLLSIPVLGSTSNAMSRIVSSAWILVIQINTGNLVPGLGKLENLKHLSLFNNSIQGTIPVELGNLKNLISLNLYQNNISGTIPSSLGNLKSLVFLRINNNKLTGPIPTELEGASSLQVVDVSNNDLCGTIPTGGPFANIPADSFKNNPRLGTGGPC